MLISRYAAASAQRVAAHRHLLSVLWALTVSLWFLRHVAEVSDPGVASPFLRGSRFIGGFGSPHPNILTPRGDFSVTLVTDPAWGRRQGQYLPTLPLHLLIS
jgi:hypothetical protein